MAGLNSENWKVERPIGRNLSNLEAFGSLRQTPSRKPDLSVASGNCEPSSQFVHGTSELCTKYVGTARPIMLRDAGTKEV